ncbi:YrhB domain-containing protein [Streptomyces sp. NPDC002133]|uniref:YrhB domain-containing protein n=1 Tax=Streptomyces sp. NPDC002133 TaxID=3154409 RepID=UPI00331D97A4
MLWPARARRLGCQATVGGSVHYRNYLQVPHSLSRCDQVGLPAQPDRRTGRAGCGPALTSTADINGHGQPQCSVAADGLTHGRSPERPNTAEQARRIVNAHLAQMQPYPPEEGVTAVVVLVKEHRFGWEFRYQSSRYVQTGSSRDMRVGTGPVVVDRRHGRLEDLGGRQLSLSASVFSTKRRLSTESPDPCPLRARRGRTSWPGMCSALLPTIPSSPGTTGATANGTGKVGPAPTSSTWRRPTSRPSSRIRAFTRFADSLSISRCRGDSKAPRERATEPSRALAAAARSSRCRPAAPQLPTAAPAGLVMQGASTSSSENPSCPLTAESSGTGRADGRRTRRCGG